MSKKKSEKQGTRFSNLREIYFEARSKGKFFFLMSIFLIVFSAFFDTHAQMPVLAPYTMSLGATPFILGLVVGSYSLFNIVGNFVSGTIIDKNSWKPPLLFGLVGAALALFLYTLAGSAYHLILIRAGHGFLGGLLVPATLASLTMENEKDSFQALLLSIFGATIGLAAVTGPLAAGITANLYGYHMVYYGLTGLISAATITAFGLLRNQSGKPPQSKSVPISFMQILARPNLQGAFIFALGTMGSTGTLASFLPTRAKLVGLDHAQTGMLFTAFALTAIIVQISWPRILKPLINGDLRGCTFGLLSLCFSLILAATLNNMTGLFIALIIYGIGFGLLFQGMLSIVMNDSQPAWRGRAIGLFFATYSLGVFLMPPLSGLIWQYQTAIFPFYTSAAAALFSLFLGKMLCAKNG